MDGLNTHLSDEVLAGFLKSLKLLSENSVHDASNQSAGTGSGSSTGFDSSSELEFSGRSPLMAALLGQSLGGAGNQSGPAGAGDGAGGGANLSAILRTFLESPGAAGLGETSVLRAAVGYVDVYVVPLMALVGLLGNVLSFAVFGCTFMRRLSSSVYLAALAVADLGYLLCVLVSWTINTGLDLYSQDGWCQTFIYLTYVSSFLSVWYVVSFTAERYIAVHFPLRRQDLCTTRRAKLVVAGLAAFALLFYTFATWTSGVSVVFLTPVCGPLPRFSRAVHILNNMDTVITLVLPFLAILIMNARIAYKVARFYRERKSMALRTWSYSRWSKNRQHLVGAQRTQVYTRTQVRVTKMLLTVSTIFLALNLPHHTVRTYLFIMNFLYDDYQPTETYLLYHKLFQFVYYLQFCINLFLYNAFGKNFRKALQLLWRRVKHNVAESINRSYIGRTRRSFFHAGEGDITLQEYRHISGDSGKYI